MSKNGICKSFTGLGSILTGWVPDQWDFLSRGLKTIEDRVDELPLGVDAQTYNYGQWKAQVRAIEKEYRGQPLALGGHSLGVHAACSIAAELAKRGIIVDFLFAIDPTAGRNWNLTVGKNVKDVLEFWASSGPPALARLSPLPMGGKLRMGREFHGKYRLIKREVGHIPCASDPVVQDEIIKKLRRLFG